MRRAMLIGACMVAGAMLTASAQAGRYAAVPHTPGAGRTSGTGIPHNFAGSTRPAPMHEPGGAHGGAPAGSHSFTQGR